MNKTKKALIWTIDIIKKYNIPYQIAGGLAVRAYGSTRDLNDIDKYKNIYELSLPVIRREELIAIKNAC